MAKNNSEQLNELRRYSSMISNKIFAKFGIITNNSKEEWGWFVDPELNYHLFNKNKYVKNVYATKHVSIPETIKEYPKIRSRQSITNLKDFENNKDCKYKNKKIKNCFNYKKITARLVTIVIFISLSYFINYKV
jgi:hypothetical protein